VSASFHISAFADEIAPDSTEQIAVLKTNAIAFIEIRRVDGVSILDLSEQEVSVFRDQLEIAGIRTSAIASPIGKVQIRSDLEAHFQRFQIAIERAHQFDTRFVRLFSFYHEGEQTEAVRDDVLHQLHRMTELAEREGVILLHENERGIYGDCPERCVDLLSSVNNPHLRAAFDTANFLLSGADPLSAWKLLQDYVDYFHIKDAERTTGRVVPAGYGDGELPILLHRALQIGFRGFVSVEPHLQENDPDFGGNDAQRFVTAVTALRGLVNELTAN
tara:strand:+ start:4110 stop:4934 length:825 start_codon:yes stop_codon:yes gene_type:complete